MLQLRLVPLFVSVLLHGLSSWACAFPSRNWEVIGIYFPADQQRRVVPRFYVPIELQDLRVKLQQEIERRRTASLNAMSLGQAFYLARLDGEQIVSNYSVWEFVGKTLGQSIALGNVSVALREVRESEMGLAQLADYSRFDTNGGLELSPTEDAQRLWFSFLASAENNASVRRFRFQLPPATLGTMLLATPSNSVVSSPDVAVEKLADPLAVVPEYWPNDDDARRPLGGAVEWWLINLSGQSNFQLDIRRVVVDGSTGFSHALRSAELKYTLGQRQLTLDAVFELASEPDSSPVRLSLSKLLRLKGVAVDGQAVPWTTVADKDEQTSSIELLDTRLKQGAVLTITASCELGQEPDVLLPSLAIEQAYVIKGRTIVGSSNSGTVDRIRSPENRFLPREASLPPANGLSSTITENSLPLEQKRTDRNLVGELTWTSDWTGSAPAAVAEFSQRRAVWEVEALTHFTIQTASLSATAHLRLNAIDLDSNEVRLEVGRNWFIDDIKLIDATSDMRAQFTELGSGADRRTEVVVAWERKRPNVEFRLDVVAHTPRERNNALVRLSLPRLISLPGARQRDDYVVESSGRYRVQLNEDLLRTERQPRELAVWQQSLLPQLTDAWIFTADGQDNPEIMLVASEGTFASKSLTTVNRTGNKLTVEYGITVQPVSGSVDQVSLLYPANCDPSKFNFRLMQSEDENSVPVTVVPLDSRPNARERELRIVLPASFTTSFVLRAKLELDSPGLAEIFIPGVPRAIASESSLLMPRSEAQFVGQPALELIPASLCCSDEQLQLLSDETASQDTSAFVAARVDGSESHSLILSPSQAKEARGWIWDETVQHRISDDGSCLHQLVWDLELGDSPLVRVSLPNSWEFLRASIIPQLSGGVRTPIPVAQADPSHVQTTAQPATSHAVSLSLPTNARHSVSIECLSPRRDAAWISRAVMRFELVKPLVDLPILDSSSRVVVPPGKLIYQLRKPQQDARKLLDRLLPRSWWSLLAPSSSDARDSQVDGDWSTWQADGAATGVPSEMWLVDRSGLAAFLLSFALVVGAGCWIVLRRSPRRWWLALTLLAMLVIVVPLGWVPIIQLALLACSLAAFARLIEVVITGRGTQAATNGDRMPSRGVDTMLPMILLAGYAGLCTTSPAIAQDNSTSPARTLGDEDGETSAHAPNEVPPRIFGILLPVDDSGEISGNYGHIPNELWKLLTENQESRAVAESPRIISANYLLRTRMGNGNQREEIQDFTAQFVIQVTQPDIEIRLPFDAEQLQLVEGRVKDRDILVGLNKLKQIEEAVVFRPGIEDVGTLPIDLVFKPRAGTDGVVDRIAAQIPPIANSRLRIIYSGDTKFEVNAVGGIERTAVGEVLAYLGPIEQLEISWRDPARRNGFPMDVASETWIASQGDELIATGQLRIAADQLPQELQVVVDEAWEPVGANWGDARLLESGISAFGKRRVYKVQMLEPNSRSTPQVIRVLLLPRNPQDARIPLPFLALQEVSQQSMRRVLAWSADEETRWKPDGVDMWQEVAETTNNWGSLALADQKRVYRVPPSTGALYMRQQPQSTEVAIQERSTVHFDAETTRLEYRCDWLTPVRDLGGLSLLVPPNAQVESLLVDDKAVAFHAATRNNRSSLLVLLDDASAHSRLDVALRMPTELDRPIAVPRVLMQDTEHASSTVRLLRGPAIDCTFEIDAENPTRLGSISLSPSQLLDGLEIPLGELDATGANRDEPSVPIRATLSRKAPLASELCVMKLVYAEDRWSAEIFAQWAENSEVDFAFFDLPVSVRDSINSGPAPRKFIQAADSSRTTFCTLPVIGSSGKPEVSFSFPLLSGVSPQSLTVPEVRLLSGTPTTPIIALPKIVGQQAVRWKKAGRQASGPVAENLQARLSDEYNYYTPQARQNQVHWQPIESSGREARIEFVMVELTSAAVGQESKPWSLLHNESQAEFTGVVSYWVMPHGQLELRFQKPANCDVLGVEASGASASCSDLREDEFGVALQSNYLPVHIRLLVRWKPDLDREQFRLDVPKPLGASTNQGMVVAMPKPSNWKVRLPMASENTVTASDERLLESWLGLIGSVLQSQQGIANDEVAAWLVNWDPTSLRISPDAIVEPRQLSPALREITFRDDRPLPVDEFWSGLAAKFNLPPVNQAFALDDARLIQGRSRLVSNATFVLDKVPDAVSLWPRWLAAGLIAMAAALASLAASRLASKCMSILALQPWLYWLGLAAVGWLLLPAVWPSMTLATISIVMLISQSLDFRHRPRAAARS